MKSNTGTRGRRAEEIARKYLVQKGLTLLRKNYRTAGGEIDLIMRDGEVITFIEVRSRKTDNFMNVLETIDSEKCNHIIRTSQQYLQENNSVNKYNCRYDIVLLTGPLESAEIEWIKNAFEA